MKIKTELNGQPFEIEVDDSLTLELSEDKLTVRPANAPALRQPWGAPIDPPYQPIGTTTCTSGNSSDGGIGYTLYK